MKKRVWRIGIIIIVFFSIAAVGIGNEAFAGSGKGGGSTLSTQEADNPHK